MKRFVIIFSALLISGAVALGYTNVLENGTSQSITNGWDASGNMFVGDLTSGNVLNVVAGGSLTNLNAVIGNSSTSSFNRVSVASGEWNNSGDLYVGGAGAGNQLQITGGGVVSNFQGVVGFDTGALNNTVVVSDAGSRWVNVSSLFVGYNGSSNNAVTVSNGGLVSAYSVVVATNNAFNLNDGGQLEIIGGIDAGQSGFNWTTGGAMIVRGGELAGIDALDGQSKTLTLDNGEWSTGTNGIWIGETGANNALIVSNNGLAETSGDLLVGASGAGVTNNSVVIGKDGTVAADNLIVKGIGNHVDLNDGGRLNVLGDFDVAGTSGLNWNGGGKLAVFGNLTGLSGLEDDGQILHLYGTDARWDLTGQAVNVGTTGSLNQLIIDTGAVVSNQHAFVGAGPGTNNSVLVTGANAKWINSGTLTIGVSTNSGNGVTVKDSGRIEVAELAIAGSNEFILEKDGTLAVSGDFKIDSSKFKWGNGGTLIAQGDLSGLVTLGGSDKRLVLDGGSLTNSLDEFNIGWSQSGNGVVVSNGGQIVVGELVLGHAGGTNTLDISAMGRVTNTTAYVGRDPVASHKNEVTVFGDGAVWVNETLNIGWFTNSIPTGGEPSELVVNSGNKVTVSGDGLVQAKTLVIQEGNDFDLNNDGTLRMTDKFDWLSTNHFGRLNWGSGGTLSVGGEFSGLTNLTSGRILTLDGTNSMWNLTGTNIWVAGAVGTMLNVTNAATVRAANFYLDGDNVSANVASNAWLLVGDAAVTNYLAQGGAMVASTNGALLSVNNKAVLTVSEMLKIGEGSATGTVSVANKGIITAGDLEIDTGSAFNLNDKGTLAMIDGFDLDVQTNLNWNPGGTLSVAGVLTKTDGRLDEERQTLVLDGGSWNLLGSDLTVAGTNNTLNILNGGGATNLVGYVLGSNNTVAVSGDGSSWVNNGTLNLSGLSNSVRVVDGGTIKATGLNVAAGNRLVLDDDGTLFMTAGFNLEGQTNLNWNKGGNLAVGGGAFEVLTTTNGAEVLDQGHHLTIDAGGTWMTGTNGLSISGDGTTLFVKNGGRVFVGEVTNLVSDLLVASSNGVEMVVGNGATVDVGSFQVGLNTTTGTVSVLNGGTVTVNDLVVTDTNSAFNLAGTLNMVGNNSFDAGQGGFYRQNNSTLVMMGSHLTGIDHISGTNQTVEIQGGSWSNSGLLTIDGINNRLIVASTSNYSTVTCSNAVIGATIDDVNNAVSLSGSNTLWNNYGALYVGTNGFGNSLMIAAGATNLNTAALYIGTGLFGSNNVVTVMGSNSYLEVGSDLFVGGGGRGNALVVTNSGSVSVAGNMTIENGSVRGDGTILFSTNANTLTIGGTNTFIASDVVFDANGGDDLLSITNWTLNVNDSFTNQYRNFEHLTLTNSTLKGKGAVLALLNSVVLDGGVIEPNGGVLSLDDNVTFLDTPLFRIEADGKNRLELTRTGAFDLSDLGVEVTISDVAAMQTNPVILTAENSLINGFASTNIIESELMYTFNLVRTNNQVEIETKTVVDGELSSALTYAGTESIRAGFDGMKNSIFTRTKQLRRNMVATDRAISQEAYLLNSTNAPAGAMGPGDQNTIMGMHVWIQQFAGQGDYDAQGNSYGFDLNNNGTTIGFDKVIGDGLVAGVNYTYSRSSARTTNRDSLEAETYWVGAYGEWISENGFYVDALAAYGHTSYDSVRVENVYRGIASYNGDNYGAYVDVGQYFHHKNLALSPYVGLHFLTLSADAHVETNAADPIHVDGIDNTRFEAAFGLKLRHRFDTRVGRFQTTGYAEWNHNFVDDDIYATAGVSGSPHIGLSRISPDPDSVLGGIGFSWMSTDYLEIGIGYNGRFSENYEEHTGSAMIDIRF